MPVEHLGWSKASFVSRMNDNAEVLEHLYMAHDPASLQIGPRRQPPKGRSPYPGARGCYSNSKERGSKKKQSFIQIEWRKSFDVRAPWWEPKLSASFARVLSEAGGSVISQRGALQQESSGGLLGRKRSEGGAC